MALCLAHATGGYLVYEAARPSGPHRPLLLAAAVVLGNAPDFDFLPGVLLGHPAAFHRGVTHTLAAVVVVAALVWLVARLRGEPGMARRAAGFAGAAYGSHLLLDFLTVDVVPPHGAQFLWPLSQAYYLSPVSLLHEIIIDPSGRGAFLASIFTEHTAGVWLSELGLLACAVAAVHGARALYALLATPAGEAPEGS
jgi:inner membrane protein